MPIALHGLALGKASDAISPLNAVVGTGVLSHTTGGRSIISVRRDRPSSSVRPNRIKLKRNRPRTEFS